MLPFSRPKPPALPAPPRHSFRMKFAGSEFEAHGLGLIVAMFAVVLFIGVIVWGVSTTDRIADLFDGRTAQAEPAPPDRPPSQQVDSPGLSHSRHRTVAASVVNRGHISACGFPLLLMEKSALQRPRRNWFKRSRADAYEAEGWGLVVAALQGSSGIGTIIRLAVVIWGFL